MRPQAHEIDTLARRRVAEALPAEWQERDLTGRDYGIDLAVELMDRGSPTGSIALLQIKGTARRIPEPSVVANAARNTYPVQVPVHTVRYAELFGIPFFLVVCPVNANPARFLFVWLQSYIHTALDIDNPSWRGNKRSVTIHVPLQNNIPGAEGWFAHITGAPKRDRDWARVGFLLGRLIWITDYKLTALMGGPDKAAVRYVKELWQEIGGLDLFEPAAQGWGIDREFIDTAITRCELIVASDWRERSWGPERSKVQFDVYRLSQIFGSANDYHYARQAHSSGVRDFY